jgi:3-isopropylmalate/(R)-2-methylmalate dehydratase small subunit
LDFGIRCVVAPSFADIFYNNCFKNGILPVVLPQTHVDRLMAAAAEGATLTVDLAQQTINCEDGTEFHFDIDSFRKSCLLDGLDEIGLTLQKAAAIDAFEARQRSLNPWLYS